MIFSLAGSTFLILALEEAGSAYAWDSPLIIASLVVCGVSWLAFLFWEIYLAYAYSRKMSAIASRMMPVFPIWLLRRRIIAASFMYVTCNRFNSRFQ
jgi:hypothetical protein